ncbi:MAG TPA: hypothetical protein V6D17_05565 [Candidatus Obscuribacterales bacterium]
MQHLARRVLGKIKRILMGSCALEAESSGSAPGACGAAAAPSAVKEGAGKPLSWLPDWELLIKQNPELFRNHEGGAPPRVLIATAIGGHPVVTAIESLIAMALAVRGADVRVLLCDGTLPACLQATVGDWQDNPHEFAESGPAKRLCAKCKKSGHQVFESTDLPLYQMGDYITDDERRESARIAGAVPFSEIERYRYGDVAVGEHALAGALRYFAKGALEGEPLAEPVLRRYLEASILSVCASRKIIRDENIKHVVMNHGIYVPHGPFAEVARQLGAKVATWCMAYRKKCVILSHEDTYHHTLISEPTSEWENLTWTSEMEEEIMDYLRSRWVGSQDWIWFHEHPEADPHKIESELGIDFSKPTIGLLTNVVWDAQLHYPANAFPNMLDWIIKTIDYFGKRSDLQLVIRVHPAEIRGTVPSRQKVVDEVKKAFPELPANVFVIPPESSASTYAVMLQCDAGIIYGTKTGLELTSMGVPVIVAGEAWIRNKGMTMDARTEEEYFRILDSLPLSEKRLSSAKTRRARMYAYHFFFRRMIPLGMTVPADGWPPLEVRVDSLVDLLPGADQGLDVVCDGILKGTPFVYPAERRHRGNAFCSGSAQSDESQSPTESCSPYHRAASPAKNYSSASDDELAKVGSDCEESPEGGGSCFCEKDLARAEDERAELHAENCSAFSEPELAKAVASLRHQERSQ